MTERLSLSLHGEDQGAGHGHQGDLVAEEEDAQGEGEGDGSAQGEGEEHEGEEAGHALAAPEPVQHGIAMAQHHAQTPEIGAQGPVEGASLQVDAPPAAQVRAQDHPQEALQVLAQATLGLLPCCHSLKVLNSF